MAKVIARSIGRRKTAVARLRLESGKGSIVINNSPLEQYFPRAAHRILLSEPMKML
ncbi:30S ribosomal protein S9, partial [Candidatus Neomarinimicrobiota bacterium]